jgi:EmrB/QacA subfamily drug resistance transporter
MTGSARVAPRQRTTTRLTVLAAGLGPVMVALDSTIAAVAHPMIGGHLLATLPGLEWVTDAYLLALAAGLIAGGKLTDAVGRRRMFLTAIGGFGLASLGCGLSGSLGTLIGFRAAQGLFGAIVIPQAIAILRDTLSLKRTGGGGLGATAGSIVVSTGPIVGGLLIGLDGWRLIFLVNIPVATISLVLGGWLIHEPPDRPPAGRLDLPGIALLAGALFAVAWGLTDAERHGWTWSRSNAISWLITALCLLIVLIGTERRRQPARTPLVPLGLFRSRRLSTGVAIVLCARFALFTALYCVTFYLQHVHGDSAAQTGVRLLVLTAGIGAGALVAGWVLDGIGPRAALVAGSLLIAGGLIGLSQLQPHSSYRAIWPFLVLVGLGFGPVETTASRARVAGTPPGHADSARDLQSTAVQIGGLLGVSALGPILAGRLGTTALRPTQLAAGAFTSGLDTALVIAAAVALLAGIAGALSLRTTPQPPGVADLARRDPAPPAAEATRRPSGIGVPS